MSCDNATVRLDLDNEPQPDALLRIENGQSRISHDDYLEEVPEFDIETVETAIWKYTDKNDIKRVAAMQALRIALTGTSFGPSLFDIVILLGRDEVLKRLPRAIAQLRCE